MGYSPVGSRLRSSTYRIIGQKLSRPYMGSAMTLHTSENMPVLLLMMHVKESHVAFVVSRWLQTKMSVWFYVFFCF